MHADFKKLAFVSSGTPEADAAAKTLRALHGDCGAESADLIIALGGDGLMLETLHGVIESNTPVYGMNCGSVGFLMNDFSTENLMDRLRAAAATAIYPLAMRVVDTSGATHTALALNEVSLFRLSHQAAKLRILVDGNIRLEELVCDGVLVATPAGSTAYNLSAHGPILPIYSKVLALTPISPFRPRRWRGAILPNSAEVTFQISEPAKRPVSAVADNVAFQHVTEVSIRENREAAVTLLFDPGHSLEDRILNEQFEF